MEKKFKKIMIIIIIISIVITILALIISSINQISYSKSTTANTTEKRNICGETDSEYFKNYRKCKAKQNEYYKCTYSYCECKCKART